ncbi:Gp49 family protein [Escherichia coli]
MITGVWKYRGKSSREYARKDAIDQIWPLEGYLLKQKWHEAKQ